MTGAMNSLRSFFFPEKISNPTLRHVQGTLEVVMNQNVSLSCHSDSGSPPVRYMLFKGNQKVATLNRTDSTPVLFNLTINSASDVGEYKCKAEYTIPSNGKYSKSLNFTLIGRSCCIPSQHILWCYFAVFGLSSLLSDAVFLVYFYRASFQTSVKFTQLSSKEGTECDAILSLRKWFSSYHIHTLQRKKARLSPNEDAEEGSSYVFSVYQFI
uniref:Ig-like domain-containing protein n=1 Tax=Dromaius novaehollandiae TaxID=8790 RepID=A0A8C4P9T4_DRONO